MAEFCFQVWVTRAKQRRSCVGPEPEVLAVASPGHRGTTDALAALYCAACIGAAAGAELKLAELYAFTSSASDAELGGWQCCTVLRTRALPVMLS